MGMWQKRKKKLQQLQFGVDIFARWLSFKKTEETTYLKKDLFLLIQIVQSPRTVEAVAKNKSEDHRTSLIAKSPRETMLQTRKKKSDTVNFFCIIL